MKVFNKQFFIGLSSGIILTIMLLIASTFVIVHLFKQSVESTMAIEKSNQPKKEIPLPAPPLPSTQKLDFNWKIQSIEGAEIDFSTYEGKVVFLNFWATWCRPCIAEMSSIQRLYELLKDEGLEVVCISNENPEKVEEFIKEKGYDLPIYIMKGWKPKVLMTRGIPATFIISKEGMIEYQHVGGAKWDEDSVESFIRKLLNV
ncbi:MAG: TlpA family protein disulfide reductase [Candidatus Marinimicrobia bacterium]|nr:TlpA family protein disulfide reductase [Candidatus Neomarinimicrobiota bacterium]